MGVSASKATQDNERRSSSIRTSRRKRIPWPADRDFRILSIDGGGIKGLLPSMFLAGLEQRYLNGKSIASYFDLIVGTSTGGLICCGYATGKTSQEILNIYLTDGRRVFPETSLRSKLRWFVTSRNTTELRRLIENITGNFEIWQSPVRFCIPSCEAKNQDVYIWKTPHHPDYNLDWSEKISAAAIATSSAPTFFREFANGAFEHLDGGLFANNPSLVGVAEALSAFDVPSERIMMLSLGCGNFGAPSLTWSKKRFGGLVAWHDIYKWLFHFQHSHVFGLTGLLIGPENYFRINPKISEPEISLDDYSKSIVVLPPVAEALLREHGDTVASNFLSTEAGVYRPYRSPSTQRIT